jgi:hypothetical protein
MGISIHPMIHTHSAPRRSIGDGSNQEKRQETAGRETRKDLGKPSLASYKDHLQASQPPGDETDIMGVSSFNVGLQLGMLKELSNSIHKNKGTSK